MSKEKLIRVNASLFAARNGYKFDREEQHDDWVENGCDEGHRIKVGYVFSNEETGDEITLGGTCQHKYMLFKMWKNLDVTDITPALTSIGEKFWLIERDWMWGIVDEIVARKKIQIDFTSIPVPEDIDAYRRTMSELHSQALAITKARLKEEKEHRKMSEKTLSFMADKDYASIRQISVPWNNELEATRKDLLRKFEKWGWNEKQRGLVRYIAGEFKRRASCPEMSGDEVDKMNSILSMAREINTANEATPFEIDFTTSILKQKGMLTEKQIPIAVRILLGYSQHKNISVGFSIKDILLKFKRS